MNSSLSVADNGGVYAGIASGSVFGLVFLIAGICALFRFCCVAMKVSTTNTKPDNTYTNSYNAKPTEKDRKVTRTRPAFNLHLQLQDNKMTSAHTSSYYNPVSRTAENGASKQVYS